MRFNIVLMIAVVQSITILPRTFGENFDWSGPGSDITGDNYFGRSPGPYDNIRFFSFSPFTPTFNSSSRSANFTITNIEFVSTASAYTIIVARPGGVFKVKGSLITSSGRAQKFIVRDGSILELEGNYENMFSIRFDLINDGIIRVAQDQNLGNSSNEFYFDGGILETTASFSTNRSFVINNTAKLDVAAGTQLSCFGNFGGSGQLVKLGEGSLILIGSRNFAGRLILNEGTIQLSQDSALGSPSANIILAGGILTPTASFNTARQFSITGIGNLNVGTGLTFGITGNIEGSGQLVKTGDGTLTLSGDNTYSGGTKIEGGVLRAGANNVLGGEESISSLILAGGTLDLHSYHQDIGSLTGNGVITNDDVADVTLTVGFDGSSPAAFSGTIQNGLSSLALVKVGAGTLTLSGNNTYSGGTSIESGTWVVNGTVSGGGSATIHPGAILKGIGTITQNVTVLGTLSPGNSIGTIHLVGAQILGSGSTLSVEVDGNSADLVNVDGSMTIDPGATLTVTILPGSIFSVTSFPLIQTTGGLTGLFTTVMIDPADKPYNLFYDYDAGSLSIDFDAEPNFSGVTQPNAIAVADCLESLYLNAGPDFQSVVDQLLLITDPSELNEALQQLQPSAFTSLALSQQETLIALNDLLGERSARCTKKSKSSCKKTVAAWISPIWLRQNQTTEHDPGYRSTSYGALAGIDGKIGQSGCFGGALGYTASMLDWKKQRGTSHSNNLFGALYGSLSNAHLLFEATIVGGYHRIHVDRKIAIPSIERIAVSSHSAYSCSAHALAGYPIIKAQHQMTPYARLDYVFMHEQTFEERGANALDLHLENRNSSLGVVETGIQAASSWSLNQVAASGWLDLGFIYEKRFSGAIENSAFQAGCQMQTEGICPSRPLGVVRLGLQAQNTLSCWNLGLSYTGKFSRSFHSQSAEIDISKKF